MTREDAGESLIEQAFAFGEMEGHFILMRNDIHDAHPMTFRESLAGTNCAVAKPACTLIVPQLRVRAHLTENCKLFPHKLQSFIRISIEQGLSLQLTQRGTIHKGRPQNCRDF